MRRIASLLLLMTIVVASLHSQNATVRGFVYNRESGEPVMFTNVFLEGTTIGTATDEHGYYSLTNLKPGSYFLVSTSVGYDTVRIPIELHAGEVLTRQIFLSRVNVELEKVIVESRRQDRLQEVNVSQIKINAEDIKRIPTIGGEADLAQYLTILPGVVSSGDQGGQLYIRGGAPVHNKILLDGMTLYNAFHSIGLFSVYETEIIRRVKVLTGGFGAEYGGRISAVVDVETRDGNPQRTTGMVSASPFLSKVLIEGPISKLKPNGSSITYILTGKHSYLEQTAPAIYPYVNEIPGNGGRILPYTFTDLYGKLAFHSGNGSRFDISAFNYADNVNFTPIARINWVATGVGSHFVIVPEQSKVLISGNLVYSNYDLNMQEADQKPRHSSIGGFNLGMDFTYFYRNNSRLKYGVDINGFRTEFQFFNLLGLKYEQNQNTTEAGGYIDFRKFTNRWVFNPGFRMQYYASLFNLSLEPRLALKYNITESVRLKMSTGIYSQNLISTKSDRDVVNLFTGFLSGPEEELKTVDGSVANHKLQKSWQTVFGMEWDALSRLDLNVEGYYKDFTQLININRRKTFIHDPDFMIETGKAYGIDFLGRYETEHLFLWATYSLAWVTRYDGEQVYPTHYDRRHNMNLLASWTFGEGNRWEANARWNLGSGFPFTRTQGFYEEINFLDGVSTDYLNTNGQMGIIYEDKINAGRLPWYHRLDISLKRIIKFGPHNTMEVLASVANVYNRNNIFYFDRVRYERVNQLPIIPSIGVNFSF